jgi:PilZ domain
MSPERRRAPRYHLVADAEIAIPQSSATFKARTSDVSLLGCFMHTTRALTPGTEIRLQLTYGGATLDAAAAVARSEPSMGFGVAFSKLKPGQQTLLQTWLEGFASA